MPEHLWTSRHRKKLTGVSSSKSLQYNCLSNGNSPLININGSSIHTSHREQTPKSWSAASLEANQMLSVLSNRFGWADSRSRTVRRFSANFKCGGEARTERSPGKRILWLNHRLKISTGDDPIRWDCLLHNLPQQGSTGFISQHCPDSLSTDSCRGTPLQVQTAHQRILLNTPTLGHP